VLRPWYYLAFLAGLFLLLGLLWPYPVRAHAGLVKASPSDLCASLDPLPKPATDPVCASGLILTAPPSELRLQFSEEVQAIRRSITLVGPAGAKVELGPVQASPTELRAALNISEEGTYRVNWQVLSGDTHPVRGSFAFSLGRASATLAPAGSDIGAVAPLGLSLQLVSHWLHFLGYALGFGSIAVGWLVLQPLALTRSEQVKWRLVDTGLILLLLAEPLALLAQTASLGTNQTFDLDLLGDTLASNFGRVLAQRLGAALLLWVLVGIVKQGEASRATPLALGLGLGLALVDGQASHAISSDPAWLGLLLNTVHTAAMGIWLGGLVLLILVWRLVELHGRQVALLARFTLVAVASLTTLVITGLAMTWLHFNQPSDFLTTNYGLALSSKIVLLLVAMLLALVGSKSSSFRRTRWWGLEALTLLGLLVLAGLIVSLPPPA